MSVRLAALLLAAAAAARATEACDPSSPPTPKTHTPPNPSPRDPHPPPLALAALALRRASLGFAAHAAARGALVCLSAARSNEPLKLVRLLALADDLLFALLLRHAGAQLGTLTALDERAAAREALEATAALWRRLRVPIRLKLLGALARLLWELRGEQIGAAGAAVKRRRRVARAAGGVGGVGGAAGAGRVGGVGGVGAGAARRGVVAEIGSGAVTQVERSYVQPPPLLFQTMG
ncbi:hypothetical protein AB1Y20_012264 [Prymnesium parvum]|uniref:Peroxisomal membrane protein PEX16 n=1 Tax=Prymnesium parvum TaxID=97485 RepID=A0AB34IN12_PRYPA